MTQLCNFYSSYKLVNYELVCVYLNIEILFSKKKIMYWERIKLILFKV